MRSFLAIDVGGTKLAAGVLREDGTVLSDERTPTLASEGPDAVIARMIALGKLALEKASVPEVTAVGVGCAGPLDPVSGVVHDPPNLPGWHDVPLVRLLREAFGRQVFLENDASAAALGEQRFGAGRGVKNLVYLTISTGIGGGAVIDGKLFQGENGNAAELGHVSVDYRGRECPCGGRGCLEAYASGTSIAQRAREALRGGEPSLLTQLAGSVEAVTSGTVVEGVMRGDALARRIWDETCELLGNAIAGYINAFNPRRVVLGGGVTSAGELLFEPVRRVALGRAMKPLARIVDLVPAELGGRVGLYGAAAVAVAGVGG